jgi:cobalt-zinc-cadmium efflux system membrane fusion protein
MLRRAVLPVLCVILALAGCRPETGPEAKPASGGKAQTPVVQLTPAALQAAGLEFETVRPQGHRAMLRVPGVVKADETRLVDISSLVAGRAIEVTAVVGDRVRPGQVLSRVDSTELGFAQSDYLKAQARLAVAEKSLERAQQLLDAKVIGTGEYQRREGETLATRADHRAAADRLTLLSMTQAEIGLLARAQRINSKAAIRSPIEGTVIQRKVTTGEIVDSKTVLFVVADLRRLWVLAEVHEKDIPRVQLGLPVELQVTPYPDEIFRGVIMHVGEVIEPATRTVKVRTEVPNPDGRLKPEMFATIQIATTAEERVLTIPAMAVQKDKGKDIVFVQSAPARFEPREVAIGVPMEGRVPVLKGLAEGEQIVTKGAFALKSELNKGEMEPS